MEVSNLHDWRDAALYTIRKDTRSLHTVPIESAVECFSFFGLNFLVCEEYLNS